MKKLIHIDDTRGQLCCDNVKCGHVLAEGEVTWGEHLIGYPCPKCGSNMLTRADFEGSEKILGYVAWVNKWFGWLGTESAEGLASISIRNHDGATIIKKED